MFVTRGRSDSDLPAVPCSAVSTFYGTQTPCTGDGDLLTHFGGNSQLGGRVRQPDMNFAPQFGLAWDPGKAGRPSSAPALGCTTTTTCFATCWVTVQPGSRAAS